MDRGSGAGAAAVPEAGAEVGKRAALGHRRGAAGAAVLHRKPAESAAAHGGHPPGRHGAADPDRDRPGRRRRGSNRLRRGHAQSAGLDHDPGVGLARGDRRAASVHLDQHAAAAAQGPRGRPPAGQYLRDRAYRLAVRARRAPAADLSALPHGQPRPGAGHRPRAGASAPRGSCVEAAGLSAADDPLVQSPAVAQLCAAVPGYRAGMRRKSDQTSGLRAAGRLYAGPCHVQCEPPQNCGLSARLRRDRGKGACKICDELQKTDFLDHSSGRRRLRCPGRLLSDESDRLSI